jgi:hypothetical protein
MTFQDVLGAAMQLPTQQQRDLVIALTDHASSEHQAVSHSTTPTAIQTSNDAGMLKALTRPYAEVESMEYWSPFEAYGAAGVLQQILETENGKSQ